MKKRRQYRERSNPELDTLKKKMKRCQKKITKLARGEKRDELIKEVATLLDQIEDKYEEINENKEKEMIKNAPNDMKGLFKHIRDFKRTTNEIGPLKNGKGEIKYKEKDKREIFADYFCSLQAKPEAEECIVNWNSFLEIEKDDKPKLADEDITKEEISKVIKGLKENTSPGEDGINAKIIKEFSEILTGPLEIVFNKALKSFTGIEENYSVIIALIFKGGSKMEAKQWRPISLLNLMLRIFDKCLYA